MRVALSSHEFAQSTLDEVIDSNFNHISSKLTKLTSACNEKNELRASSRRKRASKSSNLSSNMRTSGVVQKPIDRAKKTSSPRRVVKRQSICSGSKKSRCDQCGKKYTTPSNLRVHMRIHTDHRPYACTVCDKKFTQQSNLTAHMRTHSGERPYSCSVCGEKFAQLSGLSYHTRKSKKQCGNY